MPETTRQYVWPMANEQALMLAILFLLGLFGMAVFIELYRRRNDRRMRLRNEWRAVRELCAERDLLDEDYNLLRAIITRFAPETPYKIVTRRLLFDQCMGKYFEVLHGTATEDTLERHGRQLRAIRTHLGLDYVPLGQRIYSTRELYIGQKLWAAVAAAEQAPQWFHCTVASVDEAFFRIAPAGSGARPAFAIGERVKMRLWREEDARYLLEARVHQNGVETPVWIMEHAEHLTRNQARAHYRIRFEQAVDVSILSAPLNDDYTDVDARTPVTHVHGRLTSLSGGGIAIVFQQPVPRQVLLKLSLTLPNGADPLTVYVSPVGSQLISGGRSLVRGKFVALDEETQEMITRYVFLKQKQNANEEKTFAES